MVRELITAHEVVAGPQAAASVRAPAFADEQRSRFVQRLCIILTLHFEMF
jgi:hypothetical protein